MNESFRKTATSKQSKRKVGTASNPITIEDDIENFPDSPTHTPKLFAKQSAPVKDDIENIPDSPLPPSDEIIDPDGCAAPSLFKRGKKTPLQFTQIDKSESSKQTEHRPNIPLVDVTNSPKKPASTSARRPVLPGKENQAKASASSPASDIRAKRKVAIVEQGSTLAPSAPAAKKALFSPDQSPDDILVPATPPEFLPAAAPISVRESLRSQPSTDSITLSGSHSPLFLALVDSQPEAPPQLSLLRPAPAVPTAQNIDAEQKLLCALKHEGFTFYTHLDPKNSLSPKAFQPDSNREAIWCMPGNGVTIAQVFSLIAKDKNQSFIQSGKAKDATEGTFLCNKQNSYLFIELKSINSENPNNSLSPEQQNQKSLQDLEKKCGHNYSIWVKSWQTFKTNIASLPQKDALEYNFVFAICVSNIPDEQMLYSIGKALAGYDFPNFRFLQISNDGTPTLSKSYTKEDAKNAYRTVVVKGQQKMTAFASPSNHQQKLDDSSHQSEKAEALLPLAKKTKSTHKPASQQTISTFATPVNYQQTFDDIFSKFEKAVNDGKAYAALHPFYKALKTNKDINYKKYFLPIELLKVELHFDTIMPIIQKEHDRLISLPLSTLQDQNLIDDINALKTVIKNHLDGLRALQTRLQEIKKTYFANIDENSFEREKNLLITRLIPLLKLKLQKSLEDSSKIDDQMIKQWLEKNSFIILAYISSLYTQKSNIFFLKSQPNLLNNIAGMMMFDWMLQGEISKDDASKVETPKCTSDIGNQVHISPELQALFEERHKLQLLSENPSDITVNLISCFAQTNVDRIAALNQTIEATVGRTLILVSS